MTTLTCHDTRVYGMGLNSHTGCVHYSTPLDIVAIAFKCCGRYYACYACHDALEDHPAEQWQEEEFDQEAILCGRCGAKLTIHAYLSHSFACPYCDSPFNPGCKKHWELYFQICRGVKPLYTNVSIEGCRDFPCFNRTLM